MPCSRPVGRSAPSGSYVGRLCMCVCVVCVVDVHLLCQWQVQIRRVVVLTVAVDPKQHMQHTHTHTHTKQPLWVSTPHFQRNTFREKLHQNRIEYLTLYFPILFYIFCVNLHFSSTSSYITVQTKEFVIYCSNSANTFSHTKVFLLNFLY